MTREEALRVLGLTDPFSEEELRQAYKEESFAWHPDRFTAGTKMHARAHEKFKSVNEAYSILKKSSGGNKTPPPESYPKGEPEPQVLLTEDVIYFGSDPRLDTSSISMLNRKPAKVVLLDRGVMLFIDETYIVYDGPEFIEMIHSTNHWIAERAQLDFQSYHPSDHQTGVKTVIFRVTDPSEIRESISVRLDFQNDYLAARFVKEAAQRFCPRNLSEERQAYFNKKREAAAQRQREAQAEANIKNRKQEQRLQWTEENAGKIAMMTIAIFVVSTTVVFVANNETLNDKVETLTIDSQSMVQGEGDGTGNVGEFGSRRIAEPENAVKSGNFSVWYWPILAGKINGEIRHGTPGETPQVRQSYSIVIRIKVPPEKKFVRLYDFSGTVVGTDGYTQKIPDDAYYFRSSGELVKARPNHRLPVIDGTAEILIKVPGASFAEVKDTIVVYSRILDEEQEINLMFRARE